MFDVLGFLEDALNRGSTYNPRDCLIAIACLTLLSYLVLMISGRGRG